MPLFRREDGLTDARVSPSLLPRLLLQKRREKGGLRLGASKKEGRTPSLPSSELEIAAQRKVDENERRTTDRSQSS